MEAWELGRWYMEGGNTLKVWIIEGDGE